MDHTALDFLAEGCIAGQTLLRLVARGNAIIAEVRETEIQKVERENENFVVLLLLCELFCLCFVCGYMNSSYCILPHCAVDAFE